jgi:hypothetical protein
MSVEREEEEAVAVCAACGAEIVAETERGFRIGDRGALCFQCAVERGGVYDEREDRWLVAPDLRGLEPDEA